MFTLKIDDELELALVQPSFAPRYVELARENYDHLARWLSWPPHVRSEDDFLAFIKGCLHDHADGKRLVCGVIYRGELVGNAAYVNINPGLKKLEIGYWLAASHQGLGIMTRVCRALIDHAFNRLGMEKVEARAATGNGASRALLERLGMNLEGILTRAEIINGQVLDHAHYGLQRPA
ncbi:GNAT family protein [Gallaecimonas sp. GXIMD4217]|uniref:GNAT family N-acetyltransferase n=1 Tax=Gallaecimonas sp. GXIMD4217 TaxID=3131927 RepID=UPI00311ABF8A